MKNVIFVAILLSGCLTALEKDSSTMASGKSRSIAVLKTIAGTVGTTYSALLTIYFAGYAYSHYEKQGFSPKFVGFLGGLSLCGFATYRGLLFAIRNGRDVFRASDSQKKSVVQTVVKL